VLTLLSLGAAGLTTGGAGAATFGNVTGSLNIPASQGPGGTGFGVADPYPYAFRVFGLPGKVTDLTARFANMGHNNTSDIDLLLLGPQGQQAMLMSDACGSALVINHSFVFDSAAGAVLPTASCVTGRYRPTNYEVDGNLPAPAPPVPGGSILYPTDLFAFKGTDPNGLWRVFAYDDAVEGQNGGTGGISGLVIEILVPAKCRGVRATQVGANKRSDFEVGSRRRDVIAGLGGADLVRAGRGNDLVCGGKGPDRIIAGPGRDLLIGGPGRDELVGGPGHDLCIGGPGRDTVKGCERRRGI
jgi:hypothetical protein